jgi:hypothetical protein
MATPGWSVQKRHFGPQFIARFLDLGKSHILPVTIGFRPNSGGPKSGQDKWADLDALTPGDRGKLMRDE